MLPHQFQHSINHLSFPTPYIMMSETPHQQHLSVLSQHAMWDPEHYNYRINDCGYN